MRSEPLVKLSIYITCFSVALTILVPQQAFSAAETIEPLLKKVPLLDFRHKGACAVSFCSTSQNMFIAFSEENSRKVHCWDLRTGHEVRAFSAPQGYRCDYTAPSPDGKLLLIATYDLVHDALNKVFKVILLDTQTGSVIKVLEYQDSITYVQFSRDGQRFRISPGLPSRYPEWAGTVFDGKGDPAANSDTNGFDSAESAVLAQGRYKDPIFITLLGGPAGLIKNAFEYLSVDGDKLLASSTSAGEVVIWRANDLKELFRSNFGRHPVWVRFDDRMKRFLIINGNDNENSTLYAIQVEPSK